MPLRIIGAGSNILVDDRGIKGIVVKLNSPYFKEISINPGSNYVTKQGRRVDTGIGQRIISVGAGVKLTRLIRLVRDNGLGGFELLAGIPGTLGGALVMNAGNIGDRVLDVTVVNKRAQVKILDTNDVQFGYRSSNLNRYIVLSARFKLIKKSKREIRKKMNQYLNYRHKTQDLSHPSCGCFFKNPDKKSVLRLRLVRQSDSGLMESPSTSSGCLEGCRAKSRRRAESKPSAAYFIERCGLKGSRIGDAAVSFKHANFIINKGRASSCDVLRLMEYITGCVKKRFHVHLEPEIRIWKRI